MFTFQVSSFIGITLPGQSLQPKQKRKEKQGSQVKGRYFWIGAGALLCEQNSL